MPEATIPEAPEGMSPEGAAGMSPEGPAGMAPSALAAAELPGATVPKAPAAGLFEPTVPETPRLRRLQRRATDSAAGAGDGAERDGESGGRQRLTSSEPTHLWNPDGTRGRQAATVDDDPDGDDPGDSGAARRGGQGDRDEQDHEWPAPASPGRPRARSENPSTGPGDDEDGVPVLFSGRRQTPRISMPTPPPTRVGSTGSMKASFEPPDVVPIPEVPEPGLLNAAIYAVSFVRARWQRRSAIRSIDDTIKKDTSLLDDVLGTLGQQARALGVDNRVLAAENQAIDEAEERHAGLERECAELNRRQSEEDRSFAKLEAEQQARVDNAQGELDKVEQELSTLEARQRGLRDKVKTLERQQKSYLESAEKREDEASKASMSDARAGLRRAAEDLRNDAEALNPEKQEIERKLVELERPISQARARIEARKAELDTARRGRDDAREGHHHRLSELQAEQSRKKHELAQAGAEIQRRLVTLGTLVNLHRIERPEFDDLYSRIDDLRGAIGARSSEIDRLRAEREAYDRSALVRGFVTLGIGVLAVVLFLVIIIALIT